MLRQMLLRWQRRRRAELDAQYGHATASERRSLLKMPGRFWRDPGGYSDAAEQQMDDYFDAAEGRPREDDP